MREQTRLESFMSASVYTAPVDIKKLRFIYSAIENYVNSREKKFEMLNILEVGCGEGGITLSLALLGCNVSVFDLNEKRIKTLQANLYKINNSKVIATVDNAYTFDDGKTYDIVIASEVFEHVLEPSRLARNITRRMSNGSVLIVTTPNGYGPWELKNRLDLRVYLRKLNTLRKILGKTPYVKGSGGDHCQFYTKGRLLNVFSELSYRLTNFAKTDSVLSLFPQLRRNVMLGNLDIKLADLLPYWIANGWYFTFELQKPDISPHNLQG